MFTGARHDRDLNPGSHGCEPSTLSTPYPVISAVFSWRHEITHLLNCLKEMELTVFGVYKRIKACSAWCNVHALLVVVDLSTLPGISLARVELTEPNQRWLHLTNRLSDSFKESDSSKKKSLKEYSCRLCGQHCGQKYYSLQRHRLEVHSIGHFCKICGKGFIGKSDLLGHMRSHTREKPYPCPFCPRRFSMKTNRDKHILTHTKERNFQCDICIKSFRTNGQLKKHKQVHSEARPWVCTVCGRRYKGSDNLRRHERYSHPDIVKKKKNLSWHVIATVPMI